MATFSNARMPCLLAQHCTQFNSNSLRLSQLSISASNDLRPVTGRVETADRNRAASSTICVNVPVPYIDLVSFSTTALAVQLQGMELACDQMPVKQFSKTNAAVSTSALALVRSFVYESVEPRGDYHYCCCCSSCRWNLHELWCQGALLHKHIKMDCRHPYRYNGPFDSFLGSCLRLCL